MPQLFASMLAKALQRPDRDVIVLTPGWPDETGDFDLVVATGGIPRGVSARTVIRLPAPHASATTGFIRRGEMVRIVHLPTLTSFFDLVDSALDDR